MKVKPGIRANERGQGFVEMAISLVFLLMLLAFVLDIGFAFYEMTSLRDAAQEAASYGAICPFKNPNLSTDDPKQRIIDRLMLSASSPINLEDVDVKVDDVQFRSSTGTVVTTPVMGGSVSVTATIHHKILAPFLGEIIGGTTYPLKVTVADTVLRSKWLEQCVKP